MSNPSLQTIADLAGVSRATVSLALRNQPDISEQTRQRIQKIAEEVGYRPNPLVSTLMRHLKTLRPLPDAGAIAFLTSFSTRHGWREFPFFVRYFVGASERAQQMGYRLDEIWDREPGMTAKKMQNVLVNRGVTGVLLAPRPRGHGHLSLDISQFCVAALGHSIIRPSLHRAVGDHLEGVRVALHNLRHLGYRRIALAVEDLQDRRNNYTWSAGYLESERRRAPKNRIPIHVFKRGNDSQLPRWMEAWKPDAIISGDSDIVRMLEKAGFPVPERVGVAVLDRALSDEGVAGIDQRPEVVGAAAIDLIIGQIQRNERGIPAVPKTTLTGGVWVSGESVRKVSGKSGTAPRPSAKRSSPARRTRKSVPVRSTSRPADRRSKVSAARRPRQPVA